MERRTFLSTGASILAVAAESPFIPSNIVAPDPADVVREYYRRASAADSVTEFAAQIPELTHSVSPLSDVAADVPSVFDSVLNHDLVDVEIVERDISAAEIRDISDFFDGAVAQTEVETIAETNAVVAVTLEPRNGPGKEITKEWLIAPEDGEWRLVWFDERDGSETTAKEFFRRVNQAASPGAFEQPVARLSHSASPLVNMAEYTPWYFNALRRQNLNQTTVIAENVDTSQIVRQFNTFTSWASQDTLEAVAEKNAVVELSLSDDDLEITNITQEWLMAPENGEWRVVWF